MRCESDSGALGKRPKQTGLEYKVMLGREPLQAPGTLVLGDTGIPEISRRKWFLDKHSCEHFTDGPFIPPPLAPISVF